MSIGERIKKARKERGLTQKELAKKVGVATGTIQQYELGKREPRMFHLNLVARALGIPVSRFLETDDDPMLPEVRKTFTDRLSAKLASYDPADLQATFGNPDPYRSIIDGWSPLTYSKAVEIAEKLGVSLDWLLGRVDSEDEMRLSIDDSELQSRIEEAEDELLDTVHRICGMDETNTALPYMTGKLHETWNPEKIEVVREYLEESAAIIKKLIAARRGSDNGQHQED